jgi:hypothetical protein
MLPSRSGMSGSASWTLAGPTRSRGGGRHLGRDGPAVIEADLRGLADQVGEAAVIVELEHPGPVGLGVAIDRTQGEGAGRDLVALLGRAGHDDHRRRPQGHDLLEEIEPVHPGHLDIQRHHVWIEALDELAPLSRIGGRADDRDVVLGGKARHQDRPHGG